VHGSTTDVALIANAIDNGPDGLLDLVDGRRGFQQVLVITAVDKITVADLEGEILIEHARPAPGVTHVGNGRPSGPRQDP
jgi:putative transposase